jgi:plasmid stability protein
MATLTIRDVPDGLYQRLKEIAASERRSLNAEVIVLLDQISAQRDDMQAQQEALARIDARRRARQQASVDSLTLLREDRDR